MGELGGGSFSPIEVEDEVESASPAGGVGCGAVARNVVGLGLVVGSGTEFPFIAYGPTHVEAAPYLDLNSEHDFQPVAGGADALDVVGFAAAPDVVGLSRS